MNQIFTPSPNCGAGQHCADMGECMGYCPDEPQPQTIPRKVYTDDEIAAVNIRVRKIVGDSHKRTMKTPAVCRIIAATIIVLYAAMILFIITEWWKSV